MRALPDSRGFVSRMLQKEKRDSFHLRSKGTKISTLGEKSPPRCGLIVDWALIAAISFSHYPSPWRPELSYLGFNKGRCVSNRHLLHAVLTQVSPLDDSGVSNTPLRSHGSRRETDTAWYDQHKSIQGVGPATVTSAGCDERDEVIPHNIIHGASSMATIHSMSLVTHEVLLNKSRMTSFSKSM